MQSELRQFIASAALLDHRFDGYTGSGHMRFVHPTAGIYIASSTPGVRNCIRKQLFDMERRSGKKLPRANSGHHRRKPRDKAAKRLAEQRAAQDRKEERQAAARISAIRKRDAAKSITERFRSARAAEITAADRHRREIEALMRPGHGR